MSEEDIKVYAYQSLMGLAHTHKHGFFHRDMKPENILVSGQTAKLADFGLAREIRSRPPYTDYVSTRWYRAPELLLRSTTYNSPVDIFAMGAIMAELYLGRPLFPGQNEADQLLKVFSVLGVPSKASWPEGHKMASKIGYNFPEIVPTPLYDLMPNCSEEFLDLLNKMMVIDPNNRLTAKRCLEHDFFKGFEFKPAKKKVAQIGKKPTKSFDNPNNNIQEPYYNRRLKSRKLYSGLKRHGDPAQYSKAKVSKGHKDVADTSPGGFQKSPISSTLKGLSLGGGLSKDKTFDMEEKKDDFENHLYGGLGNESDEQSGSSARGSSNSRNSRNNKKPSFSYHVKPSSVNSQNKF